MYICLERERDETGPQNKRSFIKKGNLQSQEEEENKSGKSNSYM